MRGRLGNKFSIEGDPVYDLAKVYQSVLGYDIHMMAEDGDSEDLSRDDVAYLSEIEQVFWSFVAKEYPTVRVKDIKIVTASLLFSLLPLHHEAKRPRYMKMCRDVLKEL
ncbi:hypothetical protein HDU96_000291 [Phlyctochytrium bullatum]|nr:hypothetical protein HDU96_000291 [Phlyctochytrium bullatum]